jgi:hypothetical protein
MNDDQGNSTTVAAISKTLPEEIAGWAVTEKDQIYTAKNLFEYINGGAELYISYGVEKVFNRTFTRDGQPDIIVDIFDMGGSYNAFGIFSHSRETIEQEFGQGSQHTEGLLLFWKNQYYVAILASPQTDESKQTIYKIAGQIEACIEGEGELPELLQVLPQAELIQESIRYFHHYIWLNSHYFVANENILFIDESTNAVLAKYGARGRTSVLLLVDYANDDNASRALKSFIQNYLPESSDGSVVKMEDESWTGCRITNTLLAIVFDAPDESTVRLLLDSSYKNISGTNTHSP